MVKIPKLLIQPLVENSIIHGIEPLGDTGILNISAEQLREEDKNWLVISVEDNGAGFNINNVSKVNQVGLYNIQERLQLVYDSASFTLKSSPGHGTHVIIKIPLCEETSE